ncbi:MAG TPA: CoA ester lyase [Ideonella sp.]|nr:CoA ester lyase [Ideonella sp.]
MGTLAHPTLARSLLFVPGNRPERFAKALASGAHAVIVDLEDAVSVADKAVARDAIRAFFAGGGTSLLRINPLDSAWTQEELALCGEAGVAGVVLPKAETASGVARLMRHLRAGTPVLPLIETAAGLLNVREIAAAPGVQRLLFGTVDFCLDLAIEGDGDELASYRATLVLASRGAGLQPPVDGVTLALKDEAALRAATLAAKRIGFGGKLCVHPSQAAPVNECFKPTAQQLDWAQRVLAGAATSAGAFELDGKMVDAPVIARARQLLG